MLRCSCPSFNEADQRKLVRLNGAMIDPSITEAPFRRIGSGLCWKDFCFIDFPALTLVDGPLCSVYPTEVPGLFTLSSVPHTPLGQFATAEEAQAVRDDICSEVIKEKRFLMEKQIEKYLPSFSRLFRYVGPQLAIKTKAVGAHDDRTCTVSRHDRMFSVMSGKIDTVFFAAERILSLIEVAQASSVKDTLSSLREDIVTVNTRTHLNDTGRRFRGDEIFGHSQL